MEKYSIKQIIQRKTHEWKNWQCHDVLAKVFGRLQKFIMKAPFA